MSSALRRRVTCARQVAFAVVPLVLLAGLAAQAPPPAAALSASPQAGYEALGRVTVRDARGTESGSIKVEVWGASHCRVSIDVSRPGAARTVTAVLDGKLSEISGPEALMRAIPAPSPAHGCGLLPQSAVLAAASPAAVGSAESPALSVAPATGLPHGLTWKDSFGKQVEVTYAAYAAPDGIAMPAKVTESVAGALRLTVEFRSLTTRSDFTEADFALPPPQAPTPRAAGGGQ